MKLFDPRQFAEAISVPGIDPRVWVKYATVNDYKGAIRYEDHGIYADITIQPERIAAVARVGMCYAGNGCSAWFPIQRADEVLVVCPSGNFEEGIVIVARMHNGIDQVPAEVLANPQDAYIKLGTGINFHINAGEINLNSGTKGAARLDDEVTITVLPSEISVLTAKTGDQSLNNQILTLKGKITQASNTVKVG